MPFPPLIVLALVSGLTASLAGRRELRVTPRPIPLTDAFLSYLSFAVLVLVPASAYFYAFHGDWFLLYTIDVGRIPSAIALVAFMAQAGLGAAAFILGAVLVRNQRELIVGGALGVLLLVGALTVVLTQDRISQVGSYAQYHRQYGLEAYGEGSLATGALLMGALITVGLTFLLVRLWAVGRRG